MSMIRLIFLLLPSFCLSQKVLDADQFFALGQNNFRQYSNETNSKLSLPWINEYLFRTETRDFDLNQQEYSIRLAPTTPKIRKTQKAYYNLLSNAPDLDEIEAIGEMNYSLHVDWLALYIINENLQILENLETIFADKKTIYGKSATAGILNPESLLKLQTEMNDLQIERNELNVKIAHIKSRYNLQTDSFDFNNFITIDDITKYLEQNILFPNDIQVFNTETAYKQDLLTKELDLERAEKNQIFDFAQIKYTGPHTDLLNERLSLGLGFMLNTSGRNKLKIQELQLEKEYLERKSYWDIREKKSTLDALEAKLKRDIEAYDLFQKTIEEEKNQLKLLSSNIAQSESTSPLLLLEIEGRNLDMKSKSLEKKRDLLESFLEYLKESERFNKLKTVNYLRI